MTIADWLMIVVVLAGPIIAVRLTRYLDNKKDVKKRKLEIFKILMATRGQAVSLPHVEALNRIDLEFNLHDKKEKAVIDAWKEYLDLLNSSNISPEQWGLRRIELLTELLHTMAQVLDYSFDKTHIKNSVYSPRVFGEIEDVQARLRQSLIEIIEGKRSVPIHVTDNEQRPNQ